MLKVSPVQKREYQNFVQYNWQPIYLIRQFSRSHFAQSSMAHIRDLLFRRTNSASITGHLQERISVPAVVLVLYKTLIFHKEVYLFFGELLRIDSML